MAMPRESAFLPTIKCSQCGNQVEISMMGDHLCAGVAEPSPPPDTYNQGFDNAYSQPLPIPEKYGRMPPPVDTRAANRPYMHQGQLTPGSHPGDSHGPSPRTPRTPHGLSPAHSDGYFSQPSTPLPSQPARPGGYGGFGDRSGQISPHSPEKQAGPGVMQRMNNAPTGSFDSGRRPSDSGRRPSMPRNAFPKRKESLGGRMDFLEEPSSFADRPGTANSNASNGSNGNIAPPRVPRQMGYGGFGPPARPGTANGPAPSLINRSETFPKPSFINEPPFRTPSAPGPRPDRLRQNSAFENSRRPSMGPDTSRPPPPRRSIVRPSTAGKTGSVDLAAEFGIGNPYHTPSDSASSGYSNFSSGQPSQSSTNTSPARQQPIRKPSNAANIDELMDDLESSMEGLRTEPLRIDPAAPAPPPTQSPMVESPYGISPRDRQDPAIQHGLRDDTSPTSYERPLPPRFASSPQQDAPNFGPALQQHRPRNDSLHLHMGTSPPSPRVLPPSRKGSRDPNALRGDCKACGLAITGKSISSADGRLTGKYHKACFVCTTCKEPFASAEFYVLNDKPYCEKHYHRLNGSECGSCCNGIEGQYLEDESRTKYHVGCFRCLDCGRSLSDGYFEIDGRSYCEPDAWKRMQHSEPAPAPAPRAGPGPGQRPGLPGRPNQGSRGLQGLPRPPYGLPSGNRLGPGMPGKPRPQMNKRMTRLGNM